MIATIYTTRYNFLDILEKNGYQINIIKQDSNKYMIKFCKDIKEKAKLSGFYYNYTSESFCVLIDNEKDILCEFKGRCNFSSILKHNNIKFDKI